jgi:hypothetical protein
MLWAIGSEGQDAVRYRLSGSVLRCAGAGCGGRRGDGAGPGARPRWTRPEVASARAGCKWRPATWERVRAGCGARLPFRERHAGWVAGKVPSLALVRVDQSEQSSAAGPARGGLKASCPAPGGVRRSGTNTKVRARAHARARPRASGQLEGGKGGGGRGPAAPPCPCRGDDGGKRAASAAAQGSKNPARAPEAGTQSSRALVRLMSTGTSSLLSGRAEGTVGIGKC